MQTSPAPHRRRRPNQSLIGMPTAQRPHDGALKVRHRSTRRSASRGAAAKCSTHDAQRVPRVSGIHQPVCAVRRHEANRRRRRRGKPLRLRGPRSGTNPLDPAEQAPTLMPHGSGKRRVVLNKARDRGASRCRGYQPIRPNLQTTTPARVPRTVGLDVMQAR